jgi:hypothetical protein
MFLKKLLKLPKSTPDFFVRLEAGVPKISVSIVKQAFSYWIKLANCKNGSLLNACYNETLRNSGMIEYNWKHQLSKVLGNKFNSEILYEKNPKILCMKLQKALENYSIQCNNLDVERMINSNYLPHYKNIKTNVKCEPYFNYDLPINYACLFVRLRANCQNIYIKNKKITQADHCSFCNSDCRSDWYHVILQCKAFYQERMKYINNMINDNYSKENWFKMVNSDIERNNIVNINNYFTQIAKNM